MHSIGSLSKIPVSGKCDEPYVQSPLLESSITAGLESSANRASVQIIKTVRYCNPDIRNEGIGEEKLVVLAGPNIIATAADTTAFNKLPTEAKKVVTDKLATENAKGGDTWGYYMPPSTAYARKRTTSSGTSYQSIGDKDTLTLKIGTKFGSCAGLNSEGSRSYVSVQRQEVYDLDLTGQKGELKAGARWVMGVTDIATDEIGQPKQVQYEVYENFDRGGGSKTFITVVNTDTADVMDTCPSKLLSTENYLRYAQSTPYSNYHAFNAAVGQLDLGYTLAGATVLAPENTELPELEWTNDTNSAYVKYLIIPNQVLTPAQLKSGTKYTTLDTVDTKISMTADDYSKYIKSPTAIETLNGAVYILKTQLTPPSQTPAPTPVISACDGFGTATPLLTAFMLAVASLLN